VYTAFVSVDFMGCCLATTVKVWCDSGTEDRPRLFRHSMRRRITVQFILWPAHQTLCTLPGIWALLLLNCLPDKKNRLIFFIL